MEKKETNQQKIIDNQYIIEKYLDEGGFSYVYKVKDITNNEIYALKLFKEDNNIYRNEIKINEIIREHKNKYCIQYKDSSLGKSEIPYIILEFASKGCALNYITYNKTGLNEKLCKFLFSKILTIVNSLHKMRICHRDLKLDNFLFNGDNYDIKIGDFGFSSQIIKDNEENSYKQTGEVGTKKYKAPEIYKNKYYDGEKADIFSLGVILFSLRTSKFGFAAAKEDDSLYKYIMKGKAEFYWEKLGKIFDVSDLTKDFKNLYINLVNYNPRKRPTIEEIYNDVWLKEIRDLNEKELKEYEEELKNELKKRE